MRSRSLKVRSGPPKLSCDANDGDDGEWPLNVRSEGRPAVHKGLTGGAAKRRHSSGAALATAPSDHAADVGAVARSPGGAFAPAAAGAPAVAVAAAGAPVNGDHSLASEEPAALCERAGAAADPSPPAPE